VENDRQGPLLAEKGSKTMLKMWGWLGVLFGEPFAVFLVHIHGAAQKDAAFGRQREDVSDVFGQAVASDAVAGFGEVHVPFGVHGSAELIKAHARFGAEHLEVFGKRDLEVSVAVFGDFAHFRDFDAAADVERNAKLVLVECQPCVHAVLVDGTYNAELVNAVFDWLVCPETVRNMNQVDFAFENFFVDFFAGAWEDGAFYGNQRCGVGFLSDFFGDVKDG
jgi:hypothetical protein